MQRFVGKVPHPVKSGVSKEQPLEGVKVPANLWQQSRHFPAPFSSGAVVASVRRHG